MLTKNFNTSLRYKLMFSAYAYSQVSKVPCTVFCGKKTNEFAGVSNDLTELIPSLMRVCADTYAGLFTEDGYYTTSNVNSGVLFGSGNAVATVDDYGFSGEVVPGFNSFNFTLYSMTDKSDSEAMKLQAVYTLSNNTEQDMVIGEIGLVEILAVKKSSSSTYYRDKYAVLLERTALEKPITIPAGGVGRVTYSVSIGNPIGSTATGEVAT